MLSLVSALGAFAGCGGDDTAQPSMQDEADTTDARSDRTTAPDTSTSLSTSDAGTDARGATDTGVEIAVASDTDGDADDPHDADAEAQVEAGPMCNDVSLTGAPATQPTNSVGDPPTIPMGGAIESGTYYRISRTVYYGASCAPSPPPDRSVSLLVIHADAPSSGTAQSASHTMATGDGSRVNFSYTTSGTALTTHTDCVSDATTIVRDSAAGDTARPLGFTATAKELTTYDVVPLHTDDPDAGACSTTVEVFDKP